MRTTVDLPDPLFRQLKSRAEQEGISLKELLIRSVRGELARASNAGRRTRINFPLLDSSSPGVLDRTNSEIDELLV